MKLGGAQMELAHRKKLALAAERPDHQIGIDAADRGGTQRPADIGHDAAEVTP